MSGGPPSERTAVSERNGLVRIAVHVKPRASKARVLGERNGAIELSVTAPPVDGEANQAVRELLAETLSVPVRAVVIASGESSRTKLVDVSGVTLADAQRRLGS